MNLMEYSFEAEAICLGERIKKGTFRPTLMTIPYSQITGALKTFFGKQQIHAVGRITNSPKKEYLVYSPKDQVTGTSKLPITVEYLVNASGRIYIVKNADTIDFPKVIEITLGALRTRGLGNSIMKKVGEIEIDLTSRESRKRHMDFGFLDTRIPLEHLDKFAIECRKPRFGYLFKPTSLTSGRYVLSLFEGSEVYAPKVLLKGG
ncbi:MAG: hypothetical protein QXM93_09500 [Candidatus Methanomethyliaceae archaeon]